MGFLSNAANKQADKAKGKAKDVGRRAGKKIVHGSNHCRRSPSDRHQYQIDKITTTDDEGGKHVFRMLVCKHCGQPKPGQRHM